MRDNTVLVTGGNTGIGFETAAALAGMGANVAITSRDPAKGAKAAAAIRTRHPDAAVEVLQLDLASLADVRAFAETFIAAHDRLDVLVNNAGLYLTERSETVDGFETTFQTNHLGPFLLTLLLLDLIEASAPARIVNVSSTVHHSARLDFADLQNERYSGMQAYARSKLANILFTRELARRLEGTGVTANAVHPGTVRSGFGQDGDSRGLFRLGLTLIRPFALSPAKGASTSVHLASSPDVDGITGEYWVRRKRGKASAQAHDDETARRLWEVSAELVGL